MNSLIVCDISFCCILETKLLVKDCVFLCPDRSDRCIMSVGGIFLFIGKELLKESYALLSPPCFVFVFFPSINSFN